MNQNSDISDLLNKCRKQDRGAQKELYLRFVDLLMKVAIRYAKDPSQAEDWVHDTFIKIFQNIDQYKSQSFEAWIKRILINQALQHFRKFKKINEIEQDVLQAIPSEDISALDALQAEDVLELLNKIPLGCKMVFNLYVMEGYKHDEIGALLNISASASRAQLSRAKKILRTLLQSQNSCTSK